MAATVVEKMAFYSDPERSMKNFAAKVGVVFVLGSALFGAGGCELVASVVRARINSAGGGGAGQGGGDAGGGGECSVPDDCPGTDTLCMTRTCDMGVCGMDFAAAGPASEQVAGDCLTASCDGQGTLSAEPDDNDVLDDSNPCTEDSCDNGSPVNTPTASGTMCSDGGNGALCDGNGACVECLEGTDCTDNVCDNNVCVPGTCNDTVTNVNETDVDCGGADCTPCADGLACVAPTDCVSSVCTASVCAVPTCSDLAANGMETDVDCGGGSCSACGPNLACAVNSDCAGNDCSGSVCVPNCTDGVTTGMETDVDCGGPVCNGCATGETCAVGSDCTTGVCDATTFVCVGTSCGDAVQNGDETGVDCGGSCPMCADGLGCAVAGDCQSGVCTGMVCQASVCGDNMVVGTEVCDDGNTSSGDCCSAACDAVQACETEPNGDSAMADANGAVQLGTLYFGRIDPIGDLDYYAFTLAAATDLRVELYDAAGPGSCTGIDPEVELVDSDGTTFLVADDDAGVGSCPSINPTADIGARRVPAGTYYIRAHHFSGNGTALIDAYSMLITAESTCGDGAIESTEECDDGNTADGDGCDASCTVEAGYLCNGTPSMCALSCGDGVINGADACDDMNMIDGDGCSSTCAVETGYLCSGTPSVCALTCGDGVINGADVCDDMNTADGDGCSSSCVVEADYLCSGAPSVFVLSCGDGLINEDDICDDMNGIDGDGCSSACTIETGYFCTGEPSVCALSCGDGVINGEDTCDDMNTTDGDGCSSTCTLESGYSCAGAPSVCTEVETNCNDSTDNDGDTLTDCMDPDCAAGCDAAVAACGAGETLRVYNATTVPLSPADNTTVTSSLDVPDAGTVMRTVTQLDITHPFAADLDISLASPAGPNIELSTDNGNNGDNYTGTIFDDLCATPVVGSTAPFTGCFTPEEPLASFSSQSATGSWTLSVGDDGTGDTGTLNSWSLVLCTQ